MSIETFFLTHPAAPNFAEKVGWRNYNQMSPIGFMAELLIAEGSKGVIKNGPLYIEAMGEEDQEAMQRNKDPYLNNAASVYLGVGIRAIEGIIRTGTLDRGEINDTMKKIYSSVDLVSPSMVSDEKEIIDEDLVKMITRVAQADKTFAFFFQDGFKVLPKSLQDFYATARPHIRTRLLPRYKERMELLVEINGQRRR